jgi:hypothetical protein
MIEQLGVPHPNPLPEGEGTKNLPQKAVGEGEPQHGPFLPLSWHLWSPGECLSGGHHTQDRLRIQNKGSTRWPSGIQRVEETGHGKR